MNTPDMYDFSASVACILTLIELCQRLRADMRTRVIPVAQYASLTAFRNDIQASCVLKDIDSHRY
jgi:hypothetical protein